jgi:hypothetical protein
VIRRVGDEDAALRIDRDARGKLELRFGSEPAALQVRRIGDVPDFDHAHIRADGHQRCNAERAAVWRDASYAKRCCWRQSAQLSRWLKRMQP